ncbi:hypothetical protein [Nitrososphaera sp.]|uniref:hypothetical protein n=1 Tax=Nitrososphaera sp. TaxID=1971748 RepID=UPI00316FCBF0
MDITEELNKPLILRKQPTKTADANASYWAVFRGKPFYCQEYAAKYYKITEEQAEKFQLSECCFTHIVGLPRKNGRLHPLYDYEGWIVKDEEKHRHRYILKATGLGITELKLRRYAWKSLSNNQFANGHGCIVTGPRIDLAIDIINRIKALFPVPFPTKNTIVNLNGVKIEAFPSHHLDAMRGLNPVFVYNDEADFFPPKEQENARALSERYIPKSNPEIDFVSTPNLPGGLCERLDKDQSGIYHKRYLPYKVGVGKIYTRQEIAKAMKSPAFEREYNLRYGYGVGNIFPYKLVDACIEEYDLAIQDSAASVLAVDPAFGSSDFAIVGMEQANGILYVKEASQYARPSPAAMLELVSEFAKRYETVLVDSAHPGLIRDLESRGLSAQPVNFRTELSDMTIVASQAVKERKVRIHTAFTDLQYQLKAAVFNDRGHPDKRKLSFDLGDAFMAAVHHFRSGSELHVARI